MLHWAERASALLLRRHRPGDPRSALRELHVLVPEPGPAAAGEDPAHRRCARAVRLRHHLRRVVRPGDRARRLSHRPPVGRPLPSRASRRLGCRRRRRQIRSAFGTRKPSEIAGSAGRPLRLNQTVSAIVAPSAATRHPRPVDAQPEPGGRAEEEREEEQVGDAEVRGRVLARHREREREHREDVLVVRDDLLRRPAPHRVRVDPRDDRRRRGRPSSTVSKNPRNHQPRKRRRGEAGEVREHVGVRRGQHDGEHGERRGRPADSRGEVRSGSATSTSANTTGIRTNAIHATSPQRPGCHRCVDVS